MNIKHYFTLPEKLPPKTAMLLFNVSSQLTNALWRQYEPELTELIVQADLENNLSQQDSDFEDDVPF